MYMLMLVNSSRIVTGSTRIVLKFLYKLSSTLKERSITPIHRARGALVMADTFVGCTFPRTPGFRNYIFLLFSFPVAHSTCFKIPSYPHVSQDLDSRDGGRT